MPSAEFWNLRTWADDLRRLCDALGLDKPVVLGSSFGALVYSIIEAPAQGWTSARTLAGLAVGLVILACFVLFELSRTAMRTPMLDPRVFTHRSLAAGSLSVFVQFFALFGFIFIVLQYLQLIRGDSGLLSAVSMPPAGPTRPGRTSCPGPTPARRAARSPTPRAPTIADQGPTTMAGTEGSAAHDGDLFRIRQQHGPGRHGQALPSSPLGRSGSRRSR
jgi:pimeloyl-ACP methyl ester carboxylesterase